MDATKHYRFAMASYQCIQRLPSIEIDVKKFDYHMTLHLRWFHFHAKTFVIETRATRSLYLTQYRALLDAWRILRPMVKASEERWVTLD